MKKLFSLVLIFSLLIPVIPLYATENAVQYDFKCEEPSFEHSHILHQYFNISLFSHSAKTLEDNIKGAVQKLANGIENFETVIDITEFEIPADTEILNGIWSDLFLYNPQLIQYDYRENPKLTWYPHLGTIATFGITYLYDTPQEAYARKRAFDSEVEKITSLVKPNMRELEIALTVHDYLDLHCEYDTTPNLSIYNKLESFRADGVIVDKVGVCQSYSMAYYYIMNLLGVETDYVQSEAMDHMWNIFKIGDNWYHVDSTWDDPVPDEYAYVSHQHFLASDDLISSGENPHQYWIANHKCSDTTLDNHFWRNINGAIALDGDGNAYYHTSLKSSSGNFPYYYFEILSHDLETHNTQVVTTEERKYWYIWGTNQFSTSVFSDVSYYNGKLYYNTPTEIIETNTDGTDKKVILTYDKGDGYIYGSKLNEYLLLFGVEQHMNYECTKPEHELKEYYTSLENRIGVKPAEKHPTDIQVSVLRKYLDYEDMPGNIIATLYDENDIIKETKILKLSECNLTNPDATVPVNFENDTGEYIKLMWWNLETISPIANNITYPVK